MMLICFAIKFRLAVHHTVKSIGSSAVRAGGMKQEKATSDINMPQQSLKY